MRARCRADCIHRSRGRPPARFRWWSLSRCDPMSDVLFSPFGHPVLGSNQESSCSSVAFFTRRRFRDRTRFQRSGDSPQGPGSFVRARFYGTRFPLPERLRSCCSATDSNPWFEALDAASTPHGKPVAPLHSKFVEHSRQRDVRSLFELPSLRWFEANTFASVSSRFLVKMRTTDLCHQTLVQITGTHSSSSYRVDLLPRSVSLARPDSKRCNRISRCDLRFGEFRLPPRDFSSRCVVSETRL
jgi:hypothetical protein